ncbi:ATP-binding cassette sub-family G member 4-like isoform X2 [Chrysoperla carnea]|uniref:ATP-binding cassette sub-family G member 4-like isoform X2 n=1 Tax=Chrysoperla carnea TaxID=189513 RepID=UPI001D05D7A3|nr:ATP-binding cassette sub-family G member 4-like isoform X2 [Chrysoperla carnea]
MKFKPDVSHDSAALMFQASPSTPSSIKNGAAKIHIQEGKKPIHSLSHLPKRPPVDIQFINLNYSVNHKTILKSVSGKFRSGELTAIMGPSGAGKSTVMNILAGYKTKNLSGTVLINGKPRNLRFFRKMSCYIMQDDCLLPQLTVKETMYISANLKLGRDVSTAGKKLVVDEIIESLGLTNVRNTKACRLSGGQRKRLAIGLELVNNPPVMFFDEPTSGLDSLSCLQCISLLKSLARGGRTIICTIHQPSSRIFEIFDHLYTLVEGECMYRGSVSALVPFLNSVGLECPSYHNPADFVIEIASGDYGHEWIPKLVDVMNTEKAENLSRDIDIYGTKDDKKESNSVATASITIDATTSLIYSGEKQSKKGFPVSTFWQFWILLKRTFISTARDKTLTLLRLLAHLLVGIIIGVIYYGIGNDAEKTFSNIGCLFFLIMFTMFSSMMPTILTFPLEMGVFVREYLNYWYSAKAYYMAKTVADIPFQTVFSTIYVVMVYFMSGQPYDAKRFFMVCNINVLTSLVAQSMGLLCGAALDIESATFIGPVSSIPMILFAGFFVNFSILSKWIAWVPYASYLRYGFEGTMIAIYGEDRPMLQCNEVYCPFRSPKKILEERNMENAEYWIDWLALLGFFFALRIIVYFMLKLKMRSLR